MGFDGVGGVAAATFSHEIPAVPNISAPQLAEDEEEAAELIIDPAGLVVAYDPVTETINGDTVTMTGYE